MEKKMKKKKKIKKKKERRPSLSYGAAAAFSPSIPLGGCFA